MLSLDNYSSSITSFTKRHSWISGNFEIHGNWYAKNDNEYTERNLYRVIAEALQCHWFG